MGNFYAAWARVDLVRAQAARNLQFPGKIFKHIERHSVITRSADVSCHILNGQILGPEHSRDRNSK